MDSYQHYYSTMFANNSIPFTKTCLRSLLDSTPDDIALQVGLVRRSYEELQASRPKRHIIWHSRGGGGIGDRLQQATQIFYMALAMNATFTIDMEYPFISKISSKGSTVTSKRRR